MKTKKKRKSKTKKKNENPQKIMEKKMKIPQKK